MNLFVQHDGETYGPLSLEQVLASLLVGTFLEDDLACTEDKLEGRPLRLFLIETFPHLFPGDEEDVTQEVVANGAGLSSPAAPRSFKKWKTLSIAAVSAVFFLASTSVSYYLFRPHGPHAPGAAASTPAIAYENQNGGSNVPSAVSLEESGTNASHIANGHATGEATANPTYGTANTAAARPTAQASAAQQPIAETPGASSGQKAATETPQRIGTDFEGPAAVNIFATGPNPPVQATGSTAPPSTASPFGYESPEAAQAAAGGASQTQKTSPPQVGTTSPFGSEAPNATHNPNSMTNPDSSQPPAEAATDTSQPPSIIGDYDPKNFKFNLFQPAELSGKELTDILNERFNPPPVKIADPKTQKNERNKKTAKPEQNLKVFEGSFTLQTNFKWNPTVEIVYDIPLTPGGTPGPNASNIVMIGVYPDGAKPPPVTYADGKEVKPRSNLYNYLNPYATKFGYTAFSMQIVTNPTMINDLRECYLYGGPEWADLAFRAQDYLAKQYKLQSRKLLMIGHSLGGTFVERIAAARPDKVAAVAVYAAPEITLPKVHSGTAWYLEINRGDFMHAEYDSLYNTLRSLNDNAAFAMFPPAYGARSDTQNYYHYMTTTGNDTAKFFLKGVVDSYDSFGNVDVTKWPYVRDASKPLRIFRTDSIDAASIPAVNREFFPSEDMVKDIQVGSTSLQTLYLGNSGGKNMECLIGLPPLGTPKGILVYTQGMYYLDIQHFYDNIYYLADKGYVVFAPRLRGNDEVSDRAALRATLNFVKSTYILNSLPLLCVGDGAKANSLWDVLAAEPTIVPKAISMIEFEPGDSLDESKLPIGGGVKCPVLFVYDEKPIINVSTSDQALQSLEKVRSVNAFIKKCKERNQPARVIIVPKTTNTEALVTQKSIEATDNIFTNLLAGHAEVMKGP